MLTKKQEEWLNHLSDTHKVKIVPFNPQVKVIFEKQKQELKTYLGENVEIMLRGASNMGISGKGDVDIYIPGSENEFDHYLSLLVKSLGQPEIIYPLERARWNSKKEDIEIEIFLVNKEHPTWKESIAFEHYLNSHPDALEEYRKLKEQGNGLSTREYYRKKLEFMNEILKKSQKS